MACGNALGHRADALAGALLPACGGRPQTRPGARLPVLSPSEAEACATEETSAAGYALAWRCSLRVATTPTRVSPISSARARTYAPGQPWPHPGQQEVMPEASEPPACAMLGLPPPTAAATTA